MTAEEIRNYFWRRASIHESVQESLHPYVCDDQTRVLAEIAAQLAEINNRLTYGRSDHNTLPGNPTDRS